MPSELAAIVKLVVASDFAESQSVLPTADAVTGDAESELKALLRLAAIVPGEFDGG